MYIELANAINGAKLRTKYFQNSNLPLGGNRAAIQYENARRPAQAYVKTGVMLMKEIERLKPVSQQKKIRIGSAQKRITSTLDVAS